MNHDASTPEKNVRKQNNKFGVHGKLNERIYRWYMIGNSYYCNNTKKVFSNNFTGIDTNKC